MPFIKPPEDWSEETSSFYSGPPPTPGPYVGTVDKAWRTQVKEGGDNAGTDMALISVKIGDGKYKGATVLTNLVMMKTAAWKLNQFLDALTDGSDKQREGIKKTFYGVGWKVSDETEKLGQPITHIGKKFELPGKPIAFVLKNGSQPGKMEVDRFIMGGIVDDEDDDDDEDGGITDDPTESSTPAKESAAESAPESDGPPSEDDGDDDDPWS